jgi:hypothetical protein
LAAAIRARPRRQGRARRDQSADPPISASPAPAYGSSPSRRTTAHAPPLRELILLIGGLKILVGLHFLLACSLFAFLFTHVYLATLGRTPLAYVKPMWTGWEEEVELKEH